MHEQAGETRSSGPCETKVNGQEPLEGAGRRKEIQNSQHPVLGGGTLGRKGMKYSILDLQTQGILQEIA